MIRLLLILTLVFLLAMLVHQLKKYFTRDKKEEELRDTFIEGDLADIELEIAEEKARQEEVRKAAQQLNSKDNTNKEIDNE
jgi:ABC-type transport system involved in cytochrome bd biosynthesis fused ATPase/permease subunit